jgi:RNA polymerase sigma-70 factor (ECF subfamily)
MDFWEIYDGHGARVKKFILSLVRDEWAADDLTQETFLRVQNHLETLKDPSKVSSWVFRIAYNLCQDHFRRVKHSRKEERMVGDEESDLGEALIQLEKSAQEKLEQRQMGECVQEQIDLLPEPLKTVLVLHEILGFEQGEIADILGITIENVKVRLHRARKKLKSILEDVCSFEIDERGVLICTPDKHEP